MTMLDKKEMNFEEMISVTGGNAVGPVKETGPLGTGPLTETGPLSYPYKQNTGPLMPSPDSCDPPFKTGPIGIRV